MSHGIAQDEKILPLPTTPQKQKGKLLKNREQQQLAIKLSTVRTLYSTSQFSQSLSRSLASVLKSTQSPIRRVLSLGLGSLLSNTKGQTRRLKQLAILLALRDELQKLNRAEIEVFAQDPGFTKQDEAFLSFLNIRILRTPSGASLGESSALLSPSTLIYSPFLTLEAYDALFAIEPLPLQALVSDDFNALKEKWPKYSNERAQVERLMKGAVNRYRRRVVSGEGFWEELDQSFPIAVYIAERRTRERARM